MRIYPKLLLLISLLFVLNAHAQTDSAVIKQFIRKQADALAARNMHGRGYVKKGRMLASAYIQQQFKEYGLKPAPASRSYVQGYTFPVNTFPGKMKLKINGKKLKPGADYLVDAAAPSLSVKGLNLLALEMGGITDVAGLGKIIGQVNGRSACLLMHVDSMCKAVHIREEEFVTSLPAGCYLIPEKSKLTWTVAQKQIPATVFYVKQGALPAHATKLTAHEDALLMPESQNENLIAVAPGAVADTYIAFTAHYDHLGMMGAHTVFPGASDNASGVSMLLYLASYFAAHPQHYSILFIAFSGEEAGLLGSAYYTAHPVVPLSNIKFLTNIDIMGDATDGITVVNATEYTTQFAQWRKINDAHKYIPILKSRGKAHNSDHWYFTEAGVPSFFIYSNGGKGFYHDVYDTPDALTLDHVAGVARLLIDFVESMQ